MAGVVSRSVLADQIRDHLLEGILSGRFPPSSRIVETQVARELGTSQAPVREALRALEGIGVVQISPFRGARVRRPSPQELLGAYSVRAALEVLGARQAVPRMTDADVAGLLAYGEAMEAAARAGDGRSVAEADAAFHGRIVELAANPILIGMWRSLAPFSRTYISLVGPGADPEWSAHLHAPILEALRRRDVEGVARALETHFVEARENMARRLAEGDPAAEDAAAPAPVRGRGRPTAEGRA